MGAGRDVSRLQRPPARDADPDAVVVEMDLGPGLGQLARDRLDVLFHGVPDVQVAPGHGGGDGERARLDPVGVDVHLRAVQRLDAFDHDLLGARAADPRAHEVKDVGCGHDVRLFGGV